MRKAVRNIGILLLLALWGTLALAAWLGEQGELSLSERRPLQQLPTLSADNLLNGTYMEKFEDYAVDQFPARDSFRTLKALLSYRVLGQKDNNGIYMVQGHLAKLEYPLNTVSLSNALKKFNYIYGEYLQNTDCTVYAAVIPDKGYYLAAPNGYPAMDYAALFERVRTEMPWARWVDLTDTLDVTDYYFTDTHWRQEKLLPAATALCNAMGVARPVEITPTLVTQQFLGVYYGQAALPVKAEEIYVLESPWLVQCRVYNYETGAYSPIYDLPKLTGTDPYDVYLSGPQALLRIENPTSESDRELVIFRDSFGSSLAPLLARDYKTVTLVDIRYVSSKLLGQYLTFENQDVLFAYSTLILNNSTTLK